MFVEKVRNKKLEIRSYSVLKFQKRVPSKTVPTLLFYSRVHPRRALQDLSVSLLLDSSEDNVKAFLHRGILYTDLKR